MERAPASLRRAHSADCVLSLPGGEREDGATVLAPTHAIGADGGPVGEPQHPEISELSSVSSSKNSCLDEPCTHSKSFSPRGDGSSSPKALTRPPVRLPIVVHGGSRLHSAVSSNESRAVRTILKQQPYSIDAVDGTESTPLFYCKTTSICHTLLNAGADVNHRNRDGLTPLHRHAVMGRIAIVCALLEAGANDKLLCNRGRSALDMTSRRLEQVGSKKGKKLQAILMVLAEPGKGKMSANVAASSASCCSVM